MKTILEIGQDLDATILHLEAQGFDVTELCKAATALVVWHNTQMDKVNEEAS